MKQLIYLTFYFTSFTCISQSSSQILDYNNVKLFLRDEGVIFNSEVTNVAGYEVPNGSGRKAIYAGAFWFAGYDQNGVLRNACATYNSGHDFFSGPYSNNNSYSDPNYLSSYSDAIWTVNNWEIQNHISNFAQTGYVMPNGIVNWPGNGISSLGTSQNLAPFVDLDGDNIYEPQIGEYPDIRGDIASYIIMNDAKGIHTESGGEPMGIEIHLMVYEFLSSDYINSTSFMNLRVFNRGNNNFSNFRTGFWIDGDIGFYGDDYTGCDSTRNLMYFYNGDNNDEDQGGTLGYGLDPPSLGFVSLTNPLSSSGHYSSSSVYPNSTPQSPLEFWYSLNARSQDGTHWVYGGEGYPGSIGATTIPSNFMFSGNPYTSTGWTEGSNSASDRRTIVALDSVQFDSGQVICNDFAIIYSRIGNNLENVQGVIDLADSVKLFFDAQSEFNCSQVVAGIEENSEEAFNVFPNPNNGEFTIVPNKNWNIFSVEITDLSGRIIQSEKYTSNSTVHLDLKEEKGMFFLTMTNDEKQYSARIIVSD